MKNKELKAYAKINLSLDVLSKRADGYHEVKMIMQNISLHDDITLEKTEAGIQLTANVDSVPTDDRNLMVKAAKKMFEKYQLPGGIRMTLEKRIPVSAGMAGGSTNAAAVIRGINELYDLNLSLQEICEIGVTLGADVPYCILGKPALSEGIGEKLTEIKGCKKLPVVICKIKEGASTKLVYETLDSLQTLVHPDVDAYMEALKKEDLEEMSKLSGNILEDVTVSFLPEIKEIEEMMKENGAVISLMSGSGPTVFGIFSDEETAKKCVSVLADKKPDAFTGVFEMME